MMVLAALVALSVAVATAGSAMASVGGFDDVDTGDFYARPVQWMVDEGITTGTSQCAFSPFATLTRGQGATFIWRMEGAKKPSAPNPFSDVTAHWQIDPVAWLADKGYVTGISPTRFAPDRAMTRAEFAVVLWRVAGEPSIDRAHPFTDVTAGWQVDAVAWMAERGITTGTSPTEFSPDAPVTRGQAATFLYRFEGSPNVSLDTTTCGHASLPTGGPILLPAGTLGPRTSQAVDPATVAGISKRDGIWKMNRDWNELTDGGYLDFGMAALDPNGHTVEGFVIEVPSGLGSNHLIDGGGTVGWFTATNPLQHSHNSFIREIDRAHHYRALGVVGDAIKVNRGFAHHHDAFIVMDVRPGGPADKHYDGAQVFNAGSARLERIVIDWNHAGTIANTTGAVFTQDSAALIARDITVLDPGGTWQPIRLSGSGHHDVARIQVIGMRGPNSGNGKLAPTALIKISNGSGTFELVNSVPGADNWLIE